MELELPINDKISSKLELPKKLRKLLAENETLIPSAIIEAITPVASKKCTWFAQEIDKLFFCESVVVYHDELYAVLISKSASSLKNKSELSNSHLNLRLPKGEHSLEITVLGSKGTSTPKYLYYSDDFEIVSLLRHCSDGTPPTMFFPFRNAGIDAKQLVESGYFSESDETRLSGASELYRDYTGDTVLMLPSKQCLWFQGDTSKLIAAGTVREVILGYIRAVALGKAFDSYSSNP